MKIADLKLAMDYDEQGEWEKAHEIVQDCSSELAFRIHAYLHRKEGDVDNANYWYHRAGISPYKNNFSIEREEIMQHFK